MKTMFGWFLALTAGIASAHTHDLVDLAVIDRDSGEMLPLHHRNGRAYVAGEPGHRYAVQLRNRSGERVLAVLSIDGVNAVTGETASPEQGGYVLGPYEHAEINGWRKSMHDIAQFEFSAPDASYAARTGRPQNVGVIGVAVFRERVQWRPQPMPPIDGGPYAPRRKTVEPSTRDSAQAAAPAASAPEAKYRGSEEYASELGTGHGAREWSPVQRTQFERRSSQPDEIVEVQYDTFEHLVDRGVIRPYRHRDREPRAFALGFVPDP